MKELSIEEKAKAYDKAKSIMEKYLKSGNAGVIAENTIKKAFSELKESEDEATWLKKYLEEEISCLSIDIRDDDDRIKLKNLKRSLVWLERQGEKPVCSEEDEKIIRALTSICDEWAT